MTINALQSYVEEQTNSLDNVFGLVEAYIESAYSEYEILEKRIELKVIKENGTEDDEKELKGQASDGIVGKIRKGIIKLIEAVRKFCRNIYTKITDKFNDAKTQAAIKKAEKLAKKNKKFADEKVEVEDYTKKVKVIDKYIDKYNALGSKIAAGKKVAAEELDNLKREYNKELKIAGVAATTIGISALILFLTKHKGDAKSVNDKVNQNLDRLEKIAENEAIKDSDNKLIHEKYHKDALDPIKKLAETVGNGLSKALANLGGHISNFKKTQPNVDVVDDVKEVINGEAKSAIGGVKGVVRAGQKGVKLISRNPSDDHYAIANFHESEEQSLEDYNKEIEEAAINDLFNSILEESTEEIENVEESTSTNIDDLLNDIITESSENPSTIEEDLKNEADSIIEEQEEIEAFIDSYINDDVFTESFKDLKKATIRKVKGLINNAKRKAIKLKNSAKKYEAKAVKASPEKAGKIKSSIDVYNEKIDKFLDLSDEVNEKTDAFISKYGAPLQPLIEYYGSEDLPAECKADAKEILNLLEKMYKEADDIYSFGKEKLNKTYYEIDADIEDSEAERTIHAEMKAQLEEIEDFKSVFESSDDIESLVDDIIKEMANA